MTTEGLITPDVLQLHQEVQLLRADLQLACARHDEFIEQLRQKDRTIDGLQHKLQYLLRRLFGRSAEKIDPQQMLLFDELLKTLAPEMPSPVPQTVTESSSESPTPTNGHGRRRLPANIERQKVIHDPVR